MRALAGLLAVQLTLLMSPILLSNHVGKKKLRLAKVFNHEEDTGLSLSLMESLQLFRCSKRKLATLLL